VYHFNRVIEQSSRNIGVARWLSGWLFIVHRSEHSSFVVRQNHQPPAIVHRPSSTVLHLSREDLMDPVYSARYDRALAFAAVAHREQLRKGTSIPYIAHVVHVSVILIRHGFDEDLTIAGLLHDVVEDCNIPIDEIQVQFGQRVAQLVEAVSEQKADDGGPLPWEVRKATKLAHLRSGGPDVAALKAADAIHNARSISADLQTDGPAIWARFKRGPEPTLGYYRDILEGVRLWLAPQPITAELADAVAELAGAIERT
jgi:hypothetical protein